MCESLSKIIQGTQKNVLLYAHIHSTLPRLRFTLEVLLCPLHLSHQACICFSMQLASLVGVGGGRNCLQQINISTRVSGPSTYRTGWELLQSFLWRKEMMPNQPRENGMAQNNGVIEEHWGESLPVWLLAWASHRWPLAWRPHSTGLFSPQAWMWPHSAAEYPRPPTIPHAYTHAHTPHLCDFCFSRWLWSLCMVSSHHDSQNVGLFLKGSLIHYMLCKGLRGGGERWRIGKMPVRLLEKCAKQ